VRQLAAALIARSQLRAFKAAASRCTPWRLRRKYKNYAANVDTMIKMANFSKSMSM
jgi:hypothetical protein